MTTTKSELPSNVQLLMEKQEDFQRNALRTWLNDGLLKSLSNEQAKAYGRLMSIFYASNSVTRELLAGLKNQLQEEHQEILITELMDENRHMESILDLAMID